MLRPRPDPAVAGARLAAVVPSTVTGGWLPPAEPEHWQPIRPTAPPAEPPADEVTREERSWSPPPVLDALVPAGLRGGRWDPGRRGVVALAGVAVAAAVLAGFVLLRSRPAELVAPPTSAATAPARDAGPVVVVDVAGKVRRPGLVRLPFGARVDDAVRAAGGALPGASYDGLNLAQKLTDGEQVIVGMPTAAGSGGAPSDGRVDINTADASALDALPGIGPVLAQKIVDWRTEHGRFASVDQLREVGGIGESKYAALKSKVRV